MRFLASLFTALLIVLGIILAGALYNLERTSERVTVVYDRALAASTLTAEIAQSRYHASRFAVSGDPEQIEAAKASLVYAKQELAEASGNTGHDEQSRERIDWLTAQVDGFENELVALENSVRAAGTGPQAMALSQAIHLSGDLLAKDARAIERDLEGRAIATRATLDKVKTTTAFLAFGTILACIALAGLGARNLRCTVSRSISAIAAVTTRLAEGDRSVTIPETNRADEIGEMARALTVFRKAGEEMDALRETARRDRETLLRDTAGRFESGMGSVVSYVASASSQLEETVTGMAQASGRAAEFSDEVSTAMDRVSENMTAAASATDQFAMSIGEIGRQAASSADAAREAEDASSEATAILAELADAARETGTVVELIESIAERTNLLALNASIEAARGGEAGRGFAVVAAEVKELARRTATATVEVGERIAGMQGSTRTSVAALARIGERVRQVDTVATAIAQAVEEQSISARELATNLDMAARGAEDVRSNIAEVRDMAQRNGDSADQLLAAARGLRTEAEGLETHAREFLDSARAA
ncbi:methyl-accepting chemotaxis protein [Qipengyuania sp. MTN3-11]|uniref:methyl-accepting chemotaxis protein n=1 Tax=Qipengyuania sp. MTN3-11 TaxID=3056557 RepID=UPI0036F20E6D